MKNKHKNIIIRSPKIEQGIMWITRRNELKPTKSYYHILTKMQHSLKGKDGPWENSLKDRP